jgi:hypothetical protein
METFWSCPLLSLLQGTSPEIRTLRAYSQAGSKMSRMWVIGKAPSHLALPEPEDRFVRPPSAKDASYCARTATGSIIPETR